MQLLGGEFEFVSESAALLRIVEWAYADLPAHRLNSPPDRFTLRLSLVTPAGRSAARELPRLTLLSGEGILGACTGASDFVTLAPGQRSALIVVSRAGLQARYHVRYELLEFAVFTLAARVQQLVPLHAACVGAEGRGLLLVGDSGAGKSTTALHCLLEGLELLSEDSVFVVPETLLATGVANFLHVRPDALRFLAGSTAGRLACAPVIRRRSGVEKLEIDLRRGGFALAPQPLTLVGTVFLSAQPAPAGRLLAALPRAQLRARLQACQAYALQQPGWAGFQRRLARLPAYELRRGMHPAQGARVLKALLNEAHGAAH